MNDSSTTGRRPVSSSRSSDGVDPVEVVDRAGRRPRGRRRGVVEDRVGPDGLGAELARGRSGTPRRAPRRRRSPPGPVAAQEQREVLRADIGRHGRWTGAASSAPASTAIATSAVALASSGAARRGADSRRRPAPRSSDRLATAYHAVAARARRSCRRTARAGRRARRRPVVDRLRTARPAVGRGGRGSRPRPRPGDQRHRHLAAAALGAAPRSGGGSDDVGRGAVALGLSAERLEPGDPRGRPRRGCVVAASAARQSAAARRGPALNVSMPMTGWSDLADLLGRERVAQDVVRRARCRSRP